MSKIERREEVDNLIGLMEHNKQWEKLEDIDVYAYEQAIILLRNLLSGIEELEK